MNYMFRVIMKINGLLQNCLITFQYGFIIPPPLHCSAPHLKQSHGSFVTLHVQALNCRPPGETMASITTLWSTERVCRSCYLGVRLHVKQLGKKLPLHPCLIGKTSSSLAESSLTDYPEYCLTWRLSHYLRHVSLSLSPFSHPPF